MNPGTGGRGQHLSVVYVDNLWSMFHPVDMHVFI
jgi:hypothetical protein